MKSFQWNRYFETGIDNMDEQHQYLIELINEYEKLISDNNVAFQDIQDLLVQLATYADFHFKEEEALMLATQVDDAHQRKHLEAHRTFMEDVSGMLALLNEDNPQKARQLLEFLMHWLTYHILGMDQNMARQVTAIQGGMSPAEAFAQEEREQDSSTAPLLHALNRLFEQMSERNRELLKLTHQQEQMVEERTKQLQEANQKLELLAMTDSLTTLPNRRKAMSYLDLAWQESRDNHSPLVCIMIDADHFKQVNDSYGHDAGDRVLLALAQTLKNAFRNDDVLCRLGGDEFLVICPNTDLSGGQHIAEIARNLVNTLCIPTGTDGSWCGSISVGVAEADISMDSYHELIKLADKGVYLAKEAGKNCVRSAPLESLCWDLKSTADAYNTAILAEDLLI